MAVYSTSVYVVGYDQVLGQGDGRWVIQKRSRTTGGLIWQKTSNPTTGNDVATEVAVDSSGIYIVGYQWRIEKRNQTTGNLIWAKGTTISRSASGVAVDSSGVYIVGDDSSLSYSNLQWRIEKRSKTTGSVIWSKTSNPTNYPDMPWGVAVSSTGVYIVGYQNVAWGDKAWRIERRSLTTGSLVWSRTSNPTSGYGAYDWPWDVAVDSTGVYIVGYYNWPSNEGWRIEKRQL